MFERKLRSFKTNKPLLVNYYNKIHGTTANIGEIKRYYFGASADEVYEVLLNDYNKEVENLKTYNKKRDSLLAKELQTFNQFETRQASIRDKSKPKMTLQKLGSYVEYWTARNKGRFEITLKSRNADIKNTWKFNHIDHFKNWLSKLFDQEMDSTGQIANVDEYDLFKNVIIDNIQLIAGGCNTHESTTMEMKSSFYKFRLFNPSSRGNNCFFACLKHLTGLDESHHNLRKKFSLKSGEVISIDDACKIVQHYGYNIIIIDITCNEELDDNQQYILLKNNHYYVVEGFGPIVKISNKTKRGLLTFDFETRKTDKFDVIKATGEKLFILQDTLCCVYYRDYKSDKCNTLTLVSDSNKTSARQFIDWLNEQSRLGKTYNVIAHNGGRFDYYFFISSLTSYELLECDVHFRGTTIIGINYRGNLFKDSACFLTDSLENLSKSFKVSDGKICSFNIHGKEITSKQLCFYRPELSLEQFLELQHTDREFWDLYEKYCIYDCIALFQIWEKFSKCVNDLIEKINPYLLRACPLMACMTIGSHSKKIISEINKFKGTSNSYKKSLEVFTGLTYEKNDEGKVVQKIDYEKYKFLCKFKRGGISHCHQAGKHMSGITGVDIASQYPASLIYSKIPVGPSEWIDHYDENKCGFYLIKNVVFNSYSLKPVALGIKDQSLNWAKNEMQELYVDSYMLQYLMDNYGLVKFDVVRGLVSNKEIPSSKIFGSYIGTFYDEKKLQDKYKSEKNELYNEALRSTIKLYLNSLTGKLVENPSVHFKTIFDNDSSTVLNGQGISKVFNEEKINEWIVAGIMVYSYSKRLLFEYIKCLPNNSDDVIHIETDGIYFSTRHLDAFSQNLKNYKGEYPCKFGDDLGNLKIEKTTYEGQVAYFLGKKFYTITMSDDYNDKPRDYNDKNIYRVKGIPQKTISDDGSDIWLVDVKLYDDVYNGIDVEKQFQTLKKSLFTSNTRISSYTMKRTITAQKNYKLYE